MTDKKKPELGPSKLAIMKAITTNPDHFFQLISQEPTCFSADFANMLDELDSLSHLRKLFRFNRTLLFAGHSLGPVFNPAEKAKEQLENLRAHKLHDGHFSHTEDQGSNWFDFDIEIKAINAMQEMLGFSEPCEFLYTQEGLSANLGKLMDTFYRPSAADWQTGKTKIAYLGNEFFSDQAIIHSVINRGVETAERFGALAPNTSPTVDSLTLKIQPDERGLYNEDLMIAFVKEHAHEIQILHLSDIVFGTGQRLDIARILTELKPVIDEHHLIVGLDLAHTVGNRKVNLKEWPVTYAVGCAYKHISGSVGSGLGFYVNKDTDLKKYPPIQGWKAAASSEIFGKIDGYDAAIMMKKGAWAFRCSIPSPLALTVVQTYMKEMSKVGWDKLLAKSECLTRYMRAMLQKRLGNKIEFITPEDPNKRGAMQVFRIQGLENTEQIDQIEQLLKGPSHFGCFEVDIRKPNNIRVTPHYGYTSFSDINRMVSRLEQVVALVLSKDKKIRSNLKPEHHFGTYIENNPNIRDIDSLIRKLKREIHSCWPYPNKDLKHTKVQALTELKNQIKDGVDPQKAVDYLRNNYPQALDGIYSTRTADLLSKLTDHENAPSSVYRY